MKGILCLVLTASLFWPSAAGFAQTSDPRIFAESPSSLIGDSATASPPGIVINEANMERVELYMPGNSRSDEIGLRGWKIAEPPDKVILTIPTGQSIQAGEYKVFSWDSRPNPAAVLTLLTPDNRKTDSLLFRFDPEEIGNIIGAVNAAQNTHYTAWDLSQQRNSHNDRTYIGLWTFGEPNLE